MSHFWAGLFEHLRGRGRSALPFLVALPCLFLFTFIAARIPEDVYRHLLLPALPWIILLLSLWAVRGFLRARARRRQRLRLHPLSSDELRKAHLKLRQPLRMPQPTGKKSLVPPA